MLKSRFADKYVTAPVRATAQSRIALDIVERDCSAADMLPNAGPAEHPDVFRCTWGALVAPDGAPGRSCLQDKVQVGTLQPQF